MDANLETGYPCTFFIRPDGRQRIEPIRKMRQDDFDWFEKVGAQLSGEQWEGNYTFYADVGVSLAHDEDTPYEAIVITKEQDDPFDTFHNLRVSAESIWNAAQ